MCNRKKISLLTIVPISEHTARLIKVIGINKRDDTFVNFGEYEGFAKYETPQILKIEEGEFHNQKYTITEIQECSFSHCHDLKEIYIGAGVKKITWNMYQCDSLTQIKVDKINTVYQDKDGVLFKGNELVGFPPGRTGKYVVPEGTLRIGNTAFKSSKISSLIIQEGLEEIGCNSFYECRNLKEIVLPRSIKIVKFNYNVGRQPILQKFYLQGDKFKKGPYSIDEIINMYPEKHD